MDTLFKQLRIGDFEQAALSSSIKLDMPVCVESANSCIEQDDGWDTPIKCRPASEGHEAANRIVRLIESNYYNFGGWSNAFDTILEVILYALTGNEDEYLKIVKTLKKEALNCIVEVYSILFKALYYDFCIHDILGEVYMSVGSLSKSKHFGQFFTPMNVCDLMARIQLTDIKEMIKKSKEENRKITINDPCVGSGAMLLSCKKAIIEEYGIAGLDYFEFYGIDIEKTCVTMCKIQMILTDYKYMANLLLSKALEIRQKTDSSKNSNQTEPVSSLIA